MTTQALAPVPAPTANKAAGALEAPETSFVIEGLTYRQYLTISDALPDRAVPRLVFVDGRLTFVSPSRHHEFGSDCLCDLVKTVALGCGIPLAPARSSTYRSPDARTGVEGDGAFYLRLNAGLMRGSINIDLSTQPPPDLVIEVQYAHSADDAVSAWGRLRVPDIWRYDVRRGALLILRRRDDGSYESVERSPGLPGLTVADIVDQLQRAETLEYGAWLAQLQAWTREVIAPQVEGGGVGP